MQEREVWGAGSFAGYVHDHVTRTIGQLDVKAQILIGFATGVLAFEVERLRTLQVLSALHWNELVASEPFAVRAALSLTPSLMLALGFAFALWSLRVRLGESKGGLLFFAAIAAHQSGADYAAKSIEKSEPELIKAVLTDTYELARIASGKATWAVRGTWAVCSGLAILVGHLFVNALVS